jgi:[acyl-carrier-protein] S-malonyltransferase
VLSLEDALRLVAVRADGMASAARSRPGGMLAILGLPLERVEQIVGQSAGVTAIANVNGPGQIVVSGEDPALPDVAALAREAGAKRVVRLAVGAACHSPLMQEARDAVAEAVREVTWRPPRVPVVSGVTGQTHEDPAELARLVVEGVTAPVRWEACVRTLTTRGTATFVEVGPGSVLSSLVKRLDRDATLLPAGTDEEIDALAGREDMQRGVAVGGPAV